MIERASIRFYEVTECGYFAYGEDEAEFGYLADILEQLKSWVHGGLSLGETCTYTLDDNDDGFHAYCFELLEKQQTGDFLLIVWNEVPSVDGTMPSAKSDQRVGQAEVEFTNLPENGIPGFPTYFWFVPELNVYATIRFGAPYNGRKNLGRYLKEFIAKFTSYVRTEDGDENELEILGYANDESDEVRNLRPRFSSISVRLPGELEVIRSRRNEIRKIVKKNALYPYIDEQRDKLTTFLGYLGLADPPQIQDEHHVRFEINFRPTEQQLENMIDDWEESDDDTKWSDVGVVMRGEQQPRWFGESLARDTFDIDIEYQNGSIVEPASLLNAVTQLRPRLLDLLGE